MVASAGHVVNPVLYKNLPYDTLRDFSGVGSGSRANADKFLKLTGIAITHIPLKGASDMPDVPTIGEARYPAARFDSWIGVLAPSANKENTMSRICIAPEETSPHRKP